MKKLVVSIPLVIALLGGVEAEAVEVVPTKQQIETAIQDGTKAAKHFDEVRNIFGPRGDCGWGFLQTKLWSIWSGSQLAARKFEPYPDSELSAALKLESMLVNYQLCAEGSNEGEPHIVLRQGENIIQPIKVISDAAVQTSRWPASPKYRIPVLAFFRYSEFDPKAQTFVIVIPANGDRITYQIDFSKMP